MARRTRDASKKKRAKSSTELNPSLPSRARRKKAPARRVVYSRLTGEVLKERRPHYVRTPEQKADQQATFLATLRETANIRASCEAARVSRKTAYDWRAEDETFMALWRTAIEEAVDLLEKEAWRRGHDGVDKPIVYKGKVTSTYKEYSDRMLEILLKAHRKKFREKHELTGEDGGPILLKRVERIIVDPKEK